MFTILYPGELDAESKFILGRENFLDHRGSDGFGMGEKMEWNLMVASHDLVD